jgi:hypothetical protein
MKFKILSVLFVIQLVTNAHCKKDAMKSQPLGTLILANSITGGSNVKVNTNERDSARNYNSKVFGIAAGGEVEISIYQDNVNKGLIYSNNHEIEHGGVYSMFLSGGGSAVDAIFIQDNIPLYYNDSTIGVRVINLSPNSSPVHITLASSPSSVIFNDVPYKKITEFVKFPLRANPPANSISFQVRNETNVVLATYTLPPIVTNSNYPNISVANSRNKNITLVVKGLMGANTGTDAFGVFPIANY